MHKHIDPVNATRELRLKTGFPEDAGRGMRFVHFLALPAQLVTRYYLGVRLVGFGRMLLMLLLLFMLSNSGAGIEFDDRGDQWEAFGANLGVALMLFAMGIFFRFRRAAMRRKGERVHSLSMGTSRFARLLKADTTERYADGVYVVCLGIFMDAFNVFLGSDIMGDWLVVSGLCLLGVEKYVHNIRMKQHDGLLNAEGHELAAVVSLQAQSSTPAAPPSAPVATGLDPELAERIRARGNAVHRSQKLDGAPEPLHRQTQIAAAAKALCTGRPWAAEIALAAAVVSAFALSAGRAHAGIANGPTASAPIVVPGVQGAADLRQLANDYYFGDHGKAQNFAEAARLYRMASDAGDLAARVNLAHMTRLGQGGLKQDLRQAFLLFQSAALGGNLIAASYYADMLAAGEGAAKDEKRALQFYQQAADQLPRAKLGLAFFYRDGRGGLARSDARYLELCQQAAADGFHVAQLMLGYDLLFGNHGAQRDPAAAAPWLQRAADQDVPEAKTMLGRMYGAGIGVAQDDARAADLFIAAIEGGDHNAKYRLALLVLEGRGGQAQDPERFVRLIMEAASAGVDDAVKALEVIKNLARKGDQTMQAALTQNGASWR